MFAIPNAVMNQYDAVLRTRAVPTSQRSDYKKWLRFFYDFCAKYPVPDSRSERIRLFSEKLRAKKQTEAQCEMAAHAISLYFEIQKQEINMHESAEMALRQQSTPILAASSQRALYQLKSQYWGVLGTVYRTIAVFVLILVFVGEFWGQYIELSLFLF